MKIKIASSCLLNTVLISFLVVATFSMEISTGGSEKFYGSTRTESTVIFLDGNDDNTDYHYNEDVDGNYTFVYGEVSLGTKFNVTIKVENVTDLCAYQIDIRYNATILNCTSAIEPTWDPNYVLYGIATYRIEYWEPGRYVMGCANNFGEPQAHFNGSGLTHTFEFNITAVPEDGTFSCALNIDNTETFLLDKNNERITPIVKENGYYEIRSPDTKPPVIEIISPQETELYNQTSIPLNFTVNESVSWIGYSLDSEANVTITGNTTLTDLLEGAHTIVVYANDTAGNTGASSLVLFKVDSTPPTIQNVTQIPETGVEPDQEVTVSADVTDAISEVETVILSFTNDTKWYDLTMTYNETTGSYEAKIPEQPDETTVKYKIVASDTAGNFALNDNDGDYYVYTVLFSGEHDVAIISVTPAITVRNITTLKNVVGLGYSINITVTIENQGTHTELFNVTAYYNDTAITLPNGKNYITITLASGESTNVTFTWNTTGVAKGHYTLKAAADTVPGETETWDNTFTDSQIKVGIPGDVNGDGVVDMVDIYTELILRFMCKIGDPCYSANSDINGDGIIDMQDMYIVVLHFMET